MQTCGWEREACPSSGEIGKDLIRGLDPEAFGILDEKLFAKVEFDLGGVSRLGIVWGTGASNLWINML